MVDPIKHLSSEALTQIFSHLSTPVLTRCNSVSRTWRREILVDSVLHRNLDLTSIRDRLSQIELMQLITDLAARSSHVYREIHLDIAAFWNELAQSSRLERFDDPITFDNAMAVTFYNYTSLLTTLRLATKGQLEKLYITVSSNEDVRTYPDTVSISQIIIQGAVSLDQTMAGLKELHLSVPFPFSMTFGGSDPDSKRFTVIDSFLDEPFHGDGLLCLGFLKKAQDFAGNSLQVFEMDDDRFEIESWIDPIRTKETFDPFFREIRDSAALLKRLRLRLDEAKMPGFALDLVVHCPNLSILHLDLRNEGISRNPPTMNLKFPSTSLVSAIKSMELKLDKVNLNWESQSLQSWFGSSLEYLCLSYGFGSFTSTFLEIPIEALRSILSRCGVLKKLRLEGVSVIRSSTSPSIFELSELSLKSLETLELFSVPHLGNGIFAKLFTPNLKHLVALLSSTSSYERQLALIHLSYFLEASGSSLKELSLRTHSKTLEMDSDSLSELTRSSNRHFTLGKLEKLDLNLSETGSWGLRELIDQFRLPKVKKVSHASSPGGDQMSTQALIASSLSVENISIGTCFYYSSRFSSESVSTVRKFQGSELPSFSNLKYLYLGKHSIFFLDFFSRSQTGKVEELRVTLEYEDEETKSSVLQDLMRLLSSNRLSLLKISISRSPTNEDETSSSPRFIKYESDFKMIKEISEDPIDFSNLKSLKVEACNPLLQIFQSCLTPSLSKVDFSHLTTCYHGGMRSMTGDGFRDYYDEDVEFKREEEHIQRTQIRKAELDAEESDSDDEEYGEKRERERQREAEIDLEQREAKRSTDWI